MVRVSVLIPCRDGEEHLEATIKSLLAQTIPLAITVIDDHSTDSTPDILAKYPKVQAIRYPTREPKGYDRIGKLLNLGLKVAPKAPYYMVSGDDTFFPPDYVEKVTSLMEENEAAIASGYAQEFNPKEAPDGSGRLFTAQAWNRLTPFYENIAWESGPLQKATYLGLKFQKYPIKKKHLRPYSPASLRSFGHSSYTLGNPLLWTIGRVTKDILTRNKSPHLALNILIGHLEFIAQRKPKIEMAPIISRQKILLLKQKIPRFSR